MRIAFLGTLAIGGCVVAVTLTALAVSPSPPAANGLLTIDRLIDIKHPSSPLWAPDGTRVAFVWERAGGQNLWVGDAAGTSASRALTTFSTGDIGSPFWTADSTAIVFTHDGDLWRAPVDGAAPAKQGAGGGGQFVPSPDRTRIAFTRAGDLWVRSLGDGQETRLTSTPATETGAVWSPDGTRIAFSSATVVRREYAPGYSGAKILYTVTERTPHDLQVVSATGGAAVTIAADPAVERAPRWLDASHLVFERVSQSTTTREIVVADTTTGQGRVVVREVDEKWWSIPPSAQPGPQPSPDGRWIAFLSDRDGWDRLYVVSASGNSGGAGAEPSPVSPAGREAWRPSWSPDGTRLAFDANSQEAPGTRTLFAVTLSNGRATGAPTALTSGAGTNIAASWSPDGRAVVYQHTDTTNPADLHVTNIATTTPAPRRLSDSMPTGLDRGAFVAPTLVHYTASDGQKVPAYLFVPPRLDRAKKHPAIVWIHGDGVNQNYDGWHVERNYAVYYSFHQYLVQRGYIVLAPDYRGSIGYGRAWRQGVFADVGGKDYEDAALGARYLKSLAYVDGERIGVWGLSYGGFFTLQALTLAPREFRCGVNVAGVADYAMYYEDPWKGAWTYGRLRAPEDNPKAYAVASPLSRMDRLERPLLILHGTSDVNVPYLHSVRLADTLLKLGKDYDFVTYPGEFHYFTREHVLRDAWRRVERFFDRHLGPVTNGAASGRS